MNNIWGVQNKLGVWLDYSDETDEVFYTAVVIEATKFGFKVNDWEEWQPQNIEDTAFDAKDYLQSILPHQYFFVMTMDRKLILDEE